MSRCVSCNNCGHIGWSKPKGSVWITLVLAFFFIVPAIIYEIWRRSGNGVCETCDSSLIKPSTACQTHKPSDMGGLLLLFGIGVLGSCVVVAAFAIGNNLINGGYSSSTTPKALADECMARGLKHYQDLDQYPILANGEETLTHVLNVCKGSRDGEFKAP